MTVWVAALVGTAIGCSAGQEAAPGSETASASEPKAFMKNGKIFCPLMKAEIASVEEAEGYVDFEGTRYYVCCGFCLGKAKKDPAAVAAAAAAL
jgi:hypothetical protein